MTTIMMMTQVDENEGHDIDENAFLDAGVFEGTLRNMEGGADQAIIELRICMLQMNQNL